MGSGGRHVKGYSQPGPVPDIDEPFIDDRIREPFDNPIPPIGLPIRVLESDVVLRQCGCHVNMRGKADQPVEDPVRSYGDAVDIGIFRDPFEFGNASHILRVGTYTSTACFSIRSLKFCRR